MTESLESRFPELGKEFDELTKLERSWKKIPSNPRGIFSLMKDDDFSEIHTRLMKLRPNQKYYVSSANLAIETYGKGEVGMQIYEGNKNSYILSKIKHLKQSAQ